MEIIKAKVLLDRSNKSYFAQINNLELKVGDRVIVESQSCEEAGSIITSPKKVELKNDEELLIVKRLETKNDIKTQKENKTKEEEIKKETTKIVKEQNLDMKIVSVQLSLDNSKMIVYFTADERVDFRELVKQLASNYKLRIELRQIGSRDEVKIVGAIGPCGRICCCNGYFNEFSHVTIKMAKIQGLSLNPANISGMCGRLMCCLAYENEFYNETGKKMPKINSEVETPDGKGKAVYLNFMKECVDVKFENEIKTYPLSSLKFTKTQTQNSKNEVNDDWMSWRFKF